MAITNRSARVKSKSQVINFRISDEQYEAVQAACRTTGSKSVSSFARVAVLFWLDSHKERDGSVEDDLDLLHARFVDFEFALRRLLRKQVENVPEAKLPGLET